MTNVARDNQTIFHSWHGVGGNGAAAPGGSLDGSLLTLGNPMLSSNAYPMSLLPTFRRQGSMQRKMLPQVPDINTQVSLSAKMIDKRTSTPRGNHSYGPFFLEYTLLAEFNLLPKQKISGIYVIPSKKSSLVWFGVIFVRHGLYQEGIFRFRLVIPENYPDGDCPRLFFEHEVFHPLVDPVSHEMDVQRGFNYKWKRNVYHIWQILLYMKRCFYKIDCQSALNEEAAQLYNAEKSHHGCESQFSRRVRDCVAAWRSRIYEAPSTDDPHYLVFSPFDSELHENVRQAILKPTNSADLSLILHEAKVQQDKVPSNSINPSRNNGHSFIDPATLDLFSTSSP